jgi:tRNA-dihydrouridine synthase
MSLNFWKDIDKPIFALAPMEDVTDTVFREIVLGISNPQYLHVLFTEFTSTDGLCHPVGKDKVSHRFFVNESERTILKELGVKLVVQIWGADPEKFNRVSRMLTEEYDFDGIDINMGCPVRKIVKNVTCSALIGYPEQAKEIIRATQEGTHLPVSVKTRTGLKQHMTETWIPEVLSTRPDAMILHGRTQKMMSEYPADWNEILKARELRDELAPETVFLGNGDLFSMDDCQKRIAESGVDGVMIGRGIFKDPWIFNLPASELTLNSKLEVLQKHTELYVNTWGPEKNFNILKRFFKIYINGFYGAAELRAKLMDANNLEDVINVLAKFQPGKTV